MTVVQEKVSFFSFTLTTPRVCPLPTELTSGFTWEDHTLRSIQTLTPAACREGKVCRGDSMW